MNDIAIEYRAELFGFWRYREVFVYNDDEESVTIRGES